MLPEDAPPRRQFTLKHFLPSNLAQPANRYMPSRMDEEPNESAPPETEVKPLRLAKRNSLPRLISILMIVTIIASTVTIIVYLYKRELTRTETRQLKLRLTSTLSATNIALQEVDTALADLLLATRSTRLNDAASGLSTAVKSGRVAVIKGWQALGDLKKLETPDRINDLISPTETYLTEAQKTFVYYEEFSGMQSAAGELLKSIDGYQASPETTLALDSNALSNFAEEMIMIKKALTDISVDLPFALSPLNEENLRSLATWVALLGEANAASYESSREKLFYVTNKLSTSLRSWAAQSRELTADFFRTNKTLQKYVYLAPLYQSTIASLQSSQ